MEAGVWILKNKIKIQKNNIFDMIALLIILSPRQKNPIKEKSKKNIDANMVDKNGDTPIGLAIRYILQAFKVPHYP